MRKNTPHQVLAEIEHALEKVCKVEDGFAKYEGSWNDKRIAAIHGVPVHVVSNIRLRKFGKFAPPPAQGELKLQPKPGDLFARMDALESQVQLLIRVLQEHGVIARPNLNGGSNERTSTGSTRSPVAV